ncbi:MAG: hypothetical protein NZ522_03675 [Chitinophagales bacterium]|nr:hypothetical protein [Chitinophagales bacterium]
MKTHSTKLSVPNWLNPATWSWVQAIFSVCPCCNSFSYGISEQRRGLPCQCCQLPTDRILSIVYTCKNCGYSHEKFYPEGDTHEDSLFCDHCTPNHS